MTVTLYQSLSQCLLFLISVQTNNTATLSTKPVATKEVKQNLKVDVPPQSTPANKQQDVQFLDRFVSPKSPG